MKRLRRIQLVGVAGVVALGLSVGMAGPAVAGQPGAECGASNAETRPGESMSAKGSAFNPEGRAGEVYAGSEKTASLEHAKSEHAVSQYDIACVQVSK
jgi:hypothetical protein